VADEPAPEPAELVAGAQRLLDAIPQVTRTSSGHGAFTEQRAEFIAAHLRALACAARRFAGENIGFVDEVRHYFDVEISRGDPDRYRAAHGRLDEALGGSGPLADRMAAHRQAEEIPPHRLEEAVHAFSSALRDIVRSTYPLPYVETVLYEVVTDKPWSGFNYYEGNLQSRVAINTDLPVLATSIGHLVAHEAYPGHHTEHSRKEAGLVRSRGWQEESIFCVGTPQCLIAEGLADLALEIIAGDVPDLLVAEHLRSNGIDFDPEIAQAVRVASESMDAVRANAAWLLHEDGAAIDDVVAYIERWGLLPHVRAEKAIEFLTSPTWRAYISCYVEGLPLCRNWVGGDPARFARLLTEQVVPDDLLSA
jgi:hypothetical protein